MKNSQKKGPHPKKNFPWQRTKFYKNYNTILGYYQAISVIENSHGKNLLDLGCGDGSLTKHFTRHFTRIVGVDASKKNLRIAKKYCPSVEFHESFIENYQTEETFDTVTMLLLLEHVSHPIKILKKVSTFLKKNGVLIVHVPNALAVNRTIAKIMGSIKSEYELSPFDIAVSGHKRSYDLNKLTRDINLSGLKTVKTGGIFYKMLSTPQMDWLLKKGPWTKGLFGWGRLNDLKTDWKYMFCKACYEYGKQKPNECNVIYACGKRC